MENTFAAVVATLDIAASVEAALVAVTLTKRCAEVTVQLEVEVVVAADVRPTEVSEETLRVGLARAWTATVVPKPSTLLPRCCRRAEVRVMHAMPSM